MSPQNDQSKKCFTAFEQASTMVAVVELSKKLWLVAGIVPGIGRHPLKKFEADENRLLALLHHWHQQAVKAGREIKRVVVAFEAGRDGFWLARWLRARGIEPHVIHATSIAVSREHRRAKTDRLDTEHLKRVVLGWLRGEPDHCRMVAIPTVEEADAKRPNRERETLVGECTRIVNRVKACLARFGHSRFQSDLAQGSGPSRDPCHTGRCAAATAYAGRDASRYRAPTFSQRANQVDREGACTTPERCSSNTDKRDGEFDCSGVRHRNRDGRLARARNLIAQSAGPTSRRTVCWSNRIARRERRSSARERPRASWQRAGAPRHGATGLALSRVPPRQCAHAVV